MCLDVFRRCFVHISSTFKFRLQNEKRVKSFLFAFISPSPPFVDLFVENFCVLLACAMIMLIGWMRGEGGKAMLTPKKNKTIGDAFGKLLCDFRVFFSFIPRCIIIPTSGMPIEQQQQKKTHWCFIFK